MMPLKISVDILALGGLLDMSFLNLLFYHIKVTLIVDIANR
jgi:hypothetical protein